MLGFCSVFKYNVKLYVDFFSPPKLQSDKCENVIALSSVKGVNFQIKENFGRGNLNMINSHK